MTDATWQIGLKYRTGTVSVTADGKLGDYHELTRGRTVDFEFYFGNSQPSSTGFNSGGYDENGYGGVISHVTRYEQVRDLLTWPSAVKETRIDQQSIPWYYEDLPDSSDLATQVVSIQPTDESLGALRGVWGVVTGGEDLTRLVGSNADLRLSVFVLAEIDEYADHAAVEAALG